MTWFHIFLRISAGIVILIIISLYLFYYSAKKSAQIKIEMIDELAKIPLGSSVDDMIKLSQKLGFKMASKEFAIPSVIEMTNEDLLQNKNVLPEVVTADTDLAKFKNGKLNFGLSLFLFSRKGCVFIFKDGSLQNSRVWWLD